jgi:hypothetical protein
MTDYFAAQKRTPRGLRDFHSYYLKLCERTLSFAVSLREEGEVLCWSRLTDLAQPHSIITQSNVERNLSPFSAAFFWLRAN